MSESRRLPTIDDFEGAEHCVLEDLTVEQPIHSRLFQSGAEAREIVDEITIRDKLRGRQTFVRIYAEGWVEIGVERRRKGTSHHRIDLRYLDPVPTMQRYHPLRLLQAAAIGGGLTAIFAIPAIFGWFAGFTVPATVLSATATLAILVVAFYLSHEKICFQTLHGRAKAIRFGAGLGTIRRFRKLVPKLVDAIADAAESVHDQTAVYLRAEMREHYRLKSDGILSETECARSTGRILGNFDGPL
jgi:hypothetical protein